MGLLDIFKNFKSSENKEPLISCDIIDTDNRVSSEEIEKLHKKRIAAISLNKLHLKDVPKIKTLGPEEILFLIYVDKKKAELTFLPKYWSYTYNLNFQPTLEKLFSYGYLAFSDSKYKLNNSTLKELKNICKAKNLKNTGKKQDLINLINSVLSDKDIDEIYPNQYFQITDKGQTIVDENPHILFFHSTQYLNIDLFEADRCMKGIPNSDMFEIALRIIDKRKEYNIKDKDWGLYRNNFLSSSVVYKKMEKLDYEIKDLFIVCIIDLVGIGNNNIRDDKEDRELAPGILGFINLCQKKLNCNDEDLYMYYENAFNELELFHDKIKKDNFFKKIIKEKNI